ncbi:MAG: hypothetical protein Unbinned2299contig1000_29 [Prokaryotic dsDNA virus sp.]|nr:MAG: hypothetical protein Unbinned2299contig1000_29 [Prokaryotic dsDNA virus sp.]|tara:strand:+ start:6988 stop:8664 length:1677 start_codon:yes stop_codon:yes gene_type:complete
MADSYAGYVKRPTPINWGAVAGDIVNRMGDVEKEQEAFREKYDTLANDLYNKFGEYEAGKDQQMNQFIYNGIAAGRDVLSALHQKLKRREISPDDFNRATMSMSSEMDKLKTLTDNYDAAIVATIEGIDNGKLDNVLSGWALEKFGNLSNLGGKNLQWMPGQDGYTPLYVNEEGKPPTSLDVATNPANLIFNKVDLIEQLKPATGAIGDYKIAIANGKLNDPTARANYKNFRQELINEILSDSKAVASVLAQYGGYKPYAEGDKVPNKGIKMQISANGKEFDPQVEGLTKTAEGIVGNFIDQMVDYDETKYKVTPSKTTPTYTEEELALFSEGYNATWSATNAVDQKGFKFMDNKRYNFDIESDNTITVTNKDGEVMIEGLERGSAETAKALAPYYSEKFGGTGWQVIHKQQQRAEKIPGKVEREEYTISSEDLNKVGQITKMSEKKGEDAFAMIEEIITDGNPKAKVDFVGVESAGNLADNYNLTIKIGDKEYTILIDEGTSVVGDSYNEVLAKNKKEITKAINESLGVTTKKTIAQLTKENPNKTSKEIVEMFNAQ